MSIFNPIITLRSLGMYLQVIWRQWELTVEMTKREFSERHAGQALGFVWGFAHPVITILVYLFVFTFVFQARSGDGNEGGTYAAYLLAGLVPWMAASECMSKGTGVISSNSNLVKQVIFPLEILPTKTVAVIFFNELILLSGVLILASTTGSGLSWLALSIPILLAFQLMQMIGLAMILSTLGAYLRDLKDIVQVFCFLNIYLLPVVYKIEWLPGRWQWLLCLNPFSYQTMCFQDALYYGEVRQPWVWIVYGVFSTITLSVGYRVFSKLRTTIGNVL